MKPKVYTRAEAQEMQKQGWGLIDTSGRTRNVKERSVIALSAHKISYTIHYKANIKAKVLAEYSGHYSDEDLKVIMHATGIYYCLADRLSSIPGVFICSDGFDPGKLKHHLKTMLGNQFVDDKIVVSTSLKPILGKHNVADRLAYEVSKSTKKASMLITKDQLSKFLKKK